MVKYPVPDLPLTIFGGAANRGEVSVVMPDGQPQTTPIWRNRNGTKYSST